MTGDCQYKQIHNDEMRVNENDPSCYWCRYSLVLFERSMYSGPFHILTIINLIMKRNQIKMDMVLFCAPKKQNFYPNIMHIRTNILMVVLPPPP